MDSASRNPESGSDENAARELPERIGHYRILGLLGKGGMGAVFEAEQENPRRTVALKVVTAGVLNDDMRRRFELEAQVLGHLQHPCIAQIHEAGVFDTHAGVQPFFAMELIRGVPLGRYADEWNLGTRERLELIGRICDGVQHAHQRGVVHRDLKPDNILITEEGLPKILDFGLARATEADIQTATLHTDVGQIMGTIPYMSPEQAAGDPSAIDARSDIYSLGVVTYELVSGQLPYGADDPMVLEALRVVREDDARPLSSVNRSLRGDVETIVGKALEKEADRRYPSASALAEDIRRYLADEPITARPPSRGYQLRKFGRRHKALVAGVAAVFVALVIGLIGTARGFRAARADSQRAQSTADFFQTILLGIDPAVAQGADTTLFRSVLDDTAVRIDAELAGRPLVAASIHLTMASAYYSIGAFESALEQARTARDMYRSELGEDSEEAFHAHERVCTSLGQLQRLDQATEETRIGLDWVTRTLGPDHPFAYDMRHNLGFLLLEQGLYGQAAEWFEDVLAYRRSDPEMDPEKVLISINSLGLTRLGQGRYDEAEVLLEEAMEGRRRLSGETHPETIKAVHNLGGLYQTRGNSDEAEALYRGALERMREILGDDHDTTLNARQNLGITLRKWQRLGEAIEVHQSVFEARRRLHGPDDARTLQCEHALGVTYRMAGHLEEARRHTEHSVDGIVKWFGPDHPEALEARISAAELYRVLGDWERAEQVALEIIDGFTRTLGSDHPESLIVTRDLAIQYWRAGKWEKAEPIYRQVLEDQRRVLGNEHHETLMTAVTLGKGLHDLDRIDEALPLQGEFLIGWARLYGDAHSHNRNVADKIANSLERLDSFGSHELAIRALLGWHERTLPADSKVLSTDRSTLAHALVELDRKDEARELLEIAARADQDAGRAPSALWAVTAALADHVSFEEAEDLLIGAWEEAQSYTADTHPPIARCLARFNEAWGRPEDAAYWREQAE